MREDETDREEEHRVEEVLPEAAHEVDAEDRDGHDSRHALARPEGPEAEDEERTDRDFEDADDARKPCRKSQARVRAVLEEREAEVGADLAPAVHDEREPREDAEEQEGQAAPVAAAARIAGFLGLRTGLRREHLRFRGLRHRRALGRRLLSRVLLHGLPPGTPEGSRLTGMDALERKFKAVLKANEKKIVDMRKAIARELVDRLIENIPVWSGKSVRSIAVGNSASPSNDREPHPDRRDYAQDGPWENHSKDFGDTKNMQLGEEPMRPSSEAVARASVETTDYSLSKPVFVTSNSYIWALIEDAKAGAGRNTAVVSEIAKAQVRSKFKGVK